MNFYITSVRQDIDSSCRKILNAVDMPCHNTEEVDQGVGIFIYIQSRA